MEIMKEHAKGLSGVIHCYSYSKEMAQEYIKMGFYIGVGGVVTFKNAKKLKEVVENIPLTSIVLETDCPYMAPEPNRGKRNNSAYIRYVAEKIAELKGITYEEVVEQTEKKMPEICIPNCFMPRPKVGSAVIRLTCHQEKPVQVQDEKLMFNIIRASFNQRRKTLANGLKNAATLDFTKEEVEAAIDALGKGASVRGETLTLEEFARLSDLLSPYKKG